MPSAGILVGYPLLGCAKVCISIAVLRTGLSLSLSALLYVLQFWICSKYSAKISTETEKPVKASFKIS